MSAVLDDFLNGMLNEQPVVSTTTPAVTAPPPPPPAVVAAAAPNRIPLPTVIASNEADDGVIAAERWLIFLLGGQRYALEVAELQEVLAWQTLTAVPCAPRHVLGLIHRRGSVIPVVDIRRPLGLAVTDSTPAGALVLLPSGIALAVDAIGDVFVPGRDRQPPPSVGTPIPAVSALSRHDRETVVLLDGTALCQAATPRSGMSLA